MTESSQLSPAHDEKIKKLKVTKVTQKTVEQNKIHYRGNYM